MPSPSGRVRARVAWAVIPGVCALALSSCGSSSGHVGGASLPVQSPPALVSLMVPTPSGFTSEPTDEDSGGKAGTIGIAEAASADCDGVSETDLRQERWVTSELRYFDKNPAYPATYVLICVTELGSSSDASHNEQQLVAENGRSIGPLPAPTPFAVTGIPGAAGVLVGAAPKITFAKGRYVVFVVSAGVSAPGLAALRTLATDLASAQYQRLSG